MELDDELCMCFHVSKRKVINFVRVEQPQRAAQLSECFGAGTGCGWCRPFLKRIFDEAKDSSNAAAAQEPSSRDYAQARAAYVRAGKGSPPPGATPIEDAEAPPSE